MLSWKNLISSFLQTLPFTIGFTGGHLLVIRERTVKTLWSDDIDELQELWQEVFLPSGWDVKKPVEVKFNWRKMKTMYVLKLVKK